MFAFRPRATTFGASLPTLDDRTGTVPDLHRADVQALRHALSLAVRDAGAALDHWTAAAVKERRDSYIVYRAALDREQCAAAALAATLRPPRHGGT